MAADKMNQFTDDLVEEKIFHCRICDELCTSDIFLVKGKGNVCSNCLKKKCGEEKKPKAELNTALIHIRDKLMLPCKYQSRGCDRRMEPKNYSKHIEVCDFIINPCPMKNLEGCDWFGNNLEVGGHFLENHEHHVIKSENKIFKVESSLSTTFNVKMFSDDCAKFLLNTAVVDNKFYYALNPVVTSEVNTDYSVEHKSIQTPNVPIIKTMGTLTKLNGFYNEENLDENPNATAVDIDLLKHLADGNNIILNEFNLNPNGMDKNMLKLLECPVCRNIMRPPIYSCIARHSICILCIEQVAKCPICRENWTDSRNYSMENLTREIKYPCKHGCDEIGIESQLRKHEGTCPLHIYPCPMGCSETGNFEFILEHLKTKHRDMELPQFVQLGDYDTIKWKIFDSKLFKILITFDQFCRNTFIDVTLICSNEDPNLYTFIVKLYAGKNILNNFTNESQCAKETLLPFEGYCTGVIICYGNQITYNTLVNISIKK